MKATKLYPNQNGSVILALLSMAALSSIAFYTMMFSIKSLSRSITLDSLQNQAQQLLMIENNKSILNYTQKPELNDSAQNTRIKAGSIEFTYRQFPVVTQSLKVPFPGFSINSNYASTLITFKSQVSGQNIQTPILHTGISCVDVIDIELKSNPEEFYSLGFSSHLDDSSGYVFDSSTGKIWRQSNSATTLIMDFGFQMPQRFSRVDLASIRVAGITKLALIFAVHGSTQSNNNLQNGLYILFDQSIPSFLRHDQFTKLTQDYSLTGNETGFVVPLSNTPLQLSAITTIENTVVFSTQSQPDNQAAGMNTLYQINLSPDLILPNSSTIQTQKRPASGHSTQFKTSKVNHNELLISTKTEPQLLKIPVHCRQLFQYEK